MSRLPITACQIVELSFADVSDDLLTCTLSRIVAC